MKNTEKAVYLMNDKTMLLKDKINNQDMLIKSFKQGSPFTRTQVIVKDTNTGEILDMQENQTVLYGAMYVLRKCWGIDSLLPIPNLNTITGVANSGTAPAFADSKVCLFGVGTGGSGDGIGTVVDVKFHENQIVDMVPLRVIEPANLTPTELAQYWFRSAQPDGKTAYYLKKFEIDPVVKVLWRDAPEDEDGSVVEAGVENTTRTEPIETFVEMILKITKKDVREWFAINGQVELARFNSLALFTGVPGLLADLTTDYKDVNMFAKLNIDNEMLTYAKELTIIYRVYTS
jgi:hypothetical protein